MDTANQNSRGCRTLFLAVVFSLFVGVFGGGIAGGAAGMYFAGQQGPRTPIAAPATAAGATQVTSLQQDNAIVEAVKRVKPAVVTVLSTSQRATSAVGRARQSVSTGTGVVFDARGYIVTNQHVIDGAQKIEVLFESGEKVTADLVGADAFSDLAVLRVSGRDMPAVAAFGDSQSLQAGEPVIAIGSALGDFQNTVTVGVVSGLNRRVSANEGSALEGMIQTDAAINHGNSGGPLLNAAGQVIGINTLVVRSDGGGDTAEGLGFAVPSSTVRFVTAQLIDKGKVTRPFLGVTYTMLNPQLAAANNLPVGDGAWIQEVTPNGPAARAGLKQGDIITQIGNAALTGENSLPRVLIGYKVGDTIPLTVRRGKETLTLSVTVVERPTTG